jgi:mRNA interferase MazF
VTFHCDDVVVARFPHVEGDRFTPRPALVLSRAEFNDSHRFIMVAMITTASQSSWPSDIPIRDLASAGLRRASVLRWKITTLPVSDFGPRIGTLSKRDAARVARGRAIIFGDLS